MLLLPDDDDDYGLVPEILLSILDELIDFQFEGPITNDCKGLNKLGLSFYD
jgi:hypothetical protein